MRSLKAEHPPGSQFNYNTGDTYVPRSLISAATGKTLADYMSETIWSRLGMEFDAFYTLESEGGQEIGGSRAGIALRDFGRFGIFLLRNGVVEGTPLPPPDWIENRAPSFGFDSATNRYGATGYGYSWWLDPDGPWSPSALPANRSTSIARTTSSLSPCHASRNRPIRSPMMSIFRLNITPSRMA